MEEFSFAQLLPDRKYSRTCQNAYVQSTACSETKKTVGSILIDKKALAQALSVSVRTIDNLMSRRAIPFIKVGRIVRFETEKVKTALSRFEVRAIGEHCR